MLKIDEKFLVEQPVIRVWEFLNDVPAVVTCMPGMKYAGQTERGTYKGEMKLKLGPIAAVFEGEADVVENDSERLRVCIKSAATDKIGGNRASSVVTYRLEAVEEGTMVYIESNVKLTGSLAQMGRTGIFTDVASRLISQFADGLRIKLESESIVITDQEGQKQNELRAVRLLFVVIRDRIKRFFSAFYGIFRNC